TAHDYRDQPSNGRRTLLLHPSERHHEFNFNSVNLGLWVNGFGLHDVEDFEAWLIDADAAM
ncbi:hypothetical protein, partial [Kitasatospora sp. NPDC091276]|uniref:hypothetical protein n=1 Tax=Kitasatospora sp. NPDC091276 TaxID=3155300 RepID=UPI003443267F